MIDFWCVGLVVGLGAFIFVIDYVILRGVRRELKRAIVAENREGEK